MNNADGQEFDCSIAEVAYTAVFINNEINKVS